MHVSTHASNIKYVCMYVCMYICMHVYMYAYMYTCIYICTYVRMHVHLHVKVYVCTVPCRCVSSAITEPLFGDVAHHNGRRVVNPTVAGEIKYASKQRHYTL